MVENHDWEVRMNAKGKALIGTGLAAALALGACGGDDGSSGSTQIEQPTQAQLAAAGLQKFPLAPESDRVDLTAPAYSNSTDVTNPLFPIKDLHSALLLGRVDGVPFRAETTLLPETRIFKLDDGQEVETLVSQYLAYLDGRIEEVALDHYAQADDGSVWYFGEDVFNYERGGLANTEGTWLAGKDGPPALIMPADPKVGDTYRSENIPGQVFEEVTVNSIDQTVDGPYGPIPGAMTGSELHADGMREDKTFAPGYGEFLTGSGANVEAIALAVPADTLEEPVPAELEELAGGADAAYEAALAEDWPAASTALAKVEAAWDAYRAGEVSPRIAAGMERAISQLRRAIDGRDSTDTALAATQVAVSGLDFQLRHRPVAEIDLGRFELQAQRALVDAAAGDLAGVGADVTALEWIRDRIAHSLDPVEVTRIDAELLELRTNVTDDDLKAAAATSSSLLEALNAAG
ncbi:MAG: hypothetical protein ACRDK5_01865 [Solirubrobacterales bacterium]